ncbi:hypothetical protein [Methylobacterium oryzae]|uniref:hypothetical protein n=1 Tax=Methylobacterium oryzae TaxID=334852 RepID=UPI001F413EB5|nr:hypothetical protein [Methylobacterium oryzae]UIN38437.1 hypothetical protein LXM90_31590 [Methylobacterium oryzae]
MAHGPNPHPTSTHVAVQAAVTERSRLVREVVIDLLGRGARPSFDIADAVVSDALGLPGEGEAFRLEKGLQALDAEALAALLPRVEGMLALAQAYAAHRRA